MIKKMVVGGILLIMGFFLIIFQLNTIEEIKEKEELSKVYILNKDIRAGHMLIIDDLEEIYIRKDDKKENYIDMISDISEKNFYIVEDKIKNSILLKSDISKENVLDKYLSNGKNNIITIALGIEEANAWNFKKFDEVDLYFVSNSLDKENILYENVIIYKKVNSDPFKETYSKLETPQYLSLLVPKEKSYEILSNKRYGNYEIIVN